MYFTIFSLNGYVTVTPILSKDRGRLLSRFVTNRFENLKIMGIYIELLTRKIIRGYWYRFMEMKEEIPSLFHQT
ncbi:MAG: hypothetical protein COB93_11295 [Sneathiella sp.]|nr:MAG: hypothetical protein COB93_11295 [Sneathiella sp.]